MNEFITAQAVNKEDGEWRAFRDFKKGKIFLPLPNLAF